MSVLNPLLDFGIATWTGTRFYAVDYDGGLDTNLGYSDVDLPTAGTVAIKTLERLRQIFPRVGNGQKVVIAIKSRAGGAMYRNIANSADDEFQLIGVANYQHVLVRGTSTDATASSVAFANDAADKIFLGAQRFAGTNAAGYNPTGAPTTSVFDCTLAGGGAPGLAAEPAILGKRIRFDSATTTVALRNICRMIHANDTDTITVESNLPATPVASDVFYIEEPAVSVDRIQVSGFHGASQALQTSFSLNGLAIAGIRMPNTGASWVAFVARDVQSSFQVAFCEAYSAGFSTCTWGQIANPSITATYTDETDTSRQPGVGFACNSWGGTLANSFGAVMSACVCRTGRWQILNIANAVSIGSGSYMGAGLLFQNCKGSGGTENNVGGNLLGNNASATARRLRLIGGFSGACLSITTMDIFIRGVDIQSVGALSMITVRGNDSTLIINDTVGSTGNTGIGLDLSLTRTSTVVMGQLNANTFTATAGQDIQGAGPVYYVHADYARTDLADGFNNLVQGTASTHIGPNQLLANDANANIGQYAIVRPTTAGGAVRVAKADTAANAAGLVGVSQSAFTTAQSAVIASAGSMWIQFDAGPTAGNIAYLSTATAGNAMDTIPAVAGTNRKLRLGRIIKVSGTLGLVAYNPETLSVVADGAA